MAYGLGSLRTVGLDVALRNTEVNAAPESATGGVQL